MATEEPNSASFFSATSSPSVTSSPVDMEKSEEKKRDLMDNSDSDVERDINHGTVVNILELVKAQDAHHPMHWSAWKRWSIIVLYCLLQTFVTLTSTTYIGVEWIVEEKWGASVQVTTLGQSMFVLGTAVGPAFLGPLS